MTTPERVTALGGLIAANPSASASELGEAVNATRNTILGFITRKRAVLPEWSGQPKQSTWTEERDAILRAHWRASEPLRVIAEALGATVSNVSARAMFLGLPKKKPRPSSRVALKFGKPISDVPILPADVSPKAFLPLPGTTPKSLVDLADLRHDGTSAECHWPVEGGFCGCATGGAARYCKVHTKRSGKMVPKLVFA